MKKLLTILVGLAALPVLAQRPKALPELQETAKNANGSYFKTTNVVASGKDATVIWSDDFSNGINAWTNTGTPAAAQWEYRGAGTTPGIGTGSRGAYAGGTGPITSPTVANGFVIFDSDFLDNNGNPNTPGQGAAPTPHTSTLTSGAINLTGEANVQLTFYQYHRNFRSLTNVMVSNNAGTTWDTVFSNNIAVNQATATNNFVKVNISSVAGNQADVRVRFAFQADPSFATNGYYFWQIDDIAITTLPNNDQVLLDQDVVQGNYEFDYGQTPLFMVQPSVMRAQVLNYGIVSQTKSKLAVNVLRSNVSQGTFSSNDTTLSSQAQAVYQTNSAYTSTGTGTYSYNYTISSDSTDQDPTDNTRTLTYIVTDSTYALDHNSTNATSLGTNSFTGYTDEIQLANMYQIPTGLNPTLSSVTVRLAANAAVGGTLRVLVYDTTGFNFGANTIQPTVMESDYYTLTNLDRTRQSCRIDIPTVLNGNQQNRTLAPGGYYVAVELLSNSGTSNFAVYDDQSVTKPWYASILFLPQGGSSTSQWYSNGNAFGIRLNLKAPTSVKPMEVGLSQVQMYPNPTNGGLTQMRFSIEKSAFVTARITDVTGREIAAQQYGFMNQGNQNIALPVEKLNAGMYFVSLQAGANVYTTKLIVK